MSKPDTKLAGLELAVASIQQLPPMPRTAAKLLGMLEKPDTTSEDLQRVLAADPALVAAVLRMVNSAMFEWPQKITTISHAIMLIGFLRLRSLILATVAAGLKRLIPSRVSDLRDLLWNHSVNVSLASRLLAERAGFEWSEEAFVAGLLHDCGRLAFLALKPDEYGSLLTPGALPSPRRETSKLGVDHQALGAALLRHWRLPAQFVTVAGTHHEAEAVQGQHGSLIAIVVLADALTDGMDRVDPAPAAEALRLSEARLEDLSEDIDVQLKCARGALLGL
ncbi:MAG: HDOD domain-containing protein [Acidobacteriota bacterium]|nr:MAG: HDOD domain-containing protein [Acidobacteriota bacterium]